MGYYSKILIILIGLISFGNSYSQNNEIIWFSQTGDTVLYRSSAVTYSSDTNTRSFFNIHRKKEDDTDTKLVHKFSLPFQDTVISTENIPEKYLSKFSLTAKGHPVESLEKHDFKIKYRAKKIKESEIEDFDYIERNFIADLTLKFQRKVLFKIRNLPISYICPENHPLTLEGVASLRIWKMKEYNKYFVMLHYVKYQLINDIEMGEDHYFRAIVENNP